MKSMWFAKEIKDNVNPGLINQIYVSRMILNGQQLGYCTSCIMSTPDFAKPWFIKIRGYSFNSHFIWYFNGTPPIKKSRGLLIQGWHYPKMAVLFWEIRGTWMLPECWFHGIWTAWTIHRTMLAMPGDIVDETIISGLHLIRQKTCIHLGLVAWNSWTVVDKPSNSGAKVV